MTEVLSARALNRATLARQHLLARTDDTVLDVVEHLVGLQAQVPLDPYSALWSRIRDFDPSTLSQLLIDRALVRIVVMRGTIHLVTGADALALRPMVQPVLDYEMTTHSEYKAALAGLDVEPVLAFARPFLSEKPRSSRELRSALAEAFPDLDAGALALACRNHLALVQVPPRGVWGKSLQPTLTTAEAWLGRPLDPKASMDAVVRRYLGAFGPASAMDVSAWSRIVAMRESLESLRPELRVFHDERGRELFDLPDAPRPDPETPAPVRFLPEYDNLLLSHHDRRRFWGGPDPLSFEGASGPVKGTVLLDGGGAAVWHIDQAKPSADATLVVEHRPTLSKKERASIEAEGQRFVRFKADQTTTHDVRLVPIE